MLDKVKKFVEESFNASVTGKEFKHPERTLYWVQQLKPDADEPIFIAAYAHDIARAFRKTSSVDTFRNKELNDPQILEEHQKRGAEVLRSFLEKEGYELENIDRITNMVSRHEVGGDDESDLIKDADSISYLEVNVSKHIKMLVPTLGKDKLRRKFDWMYNRITSARAEQIAEPFYKRALEELDK